MSYFIHNDKIVGPGGGDGEEIERLTKAEYDALPEAEKLADKIRLITDDGGSPADKHIYQHTVHCGAWDSGMSAYLEMSAAFYSNEQDDLNTKAKIAKWLYDNGWNSGTNSYPASGASLTSGTSQLTRPICGIYSADGSEFYARRADGADPIANRALSTNTIQLS